MKTDANKNIIDVQYNYLNLPTQVTINGQNILYVYDATGVKLRKTVNGVTTDYANGFIYENNVLQFFNQPEGYVEPSGSNFNYIYQYKDHLGNIRLSYKDISTTSTPNLQIVEENNYYPFGLKHKGYNANINGTHHKYMFGGKEQQDELGLDWYDITARNYDPALGRWMNLDPLAEMSRRYSPYTYAVNNPIYFIDPDGMLQAPNGGSFDKDGSGNDLFIKDESAFGIIHNEYIYNPPILENSNPFHYISSNAGPGDPPKIYNGKGTAVGEDVVNQLSEVSLGTVKSRGGGYDALSHIRVLDTNNDGRFDAGIINSDVIRVLNFKKESETDKSFLMILEESAGYFFEKATSISTQMFKSTSMNTFENGVVNRRHLGLSPNASQNSVDSTIIVKVLSGNQVLLILDNNMIIKLDTLTNNAVIKN